MTSEPIMSGVLGGYAHTYARLSKPKSVAQLGPPPKGFRRGWGWVCLGEVREGGHQGLFCSRNASHSHTLVNYNKPDTGWNSPLYPGHQFGSPWWEGAGLATQRIQDLGGCYHTQSYVFISFPYFASVHQFKGPVIRAHIIRRCYFYPDRT